MKHQPLHKKRGARLGQHLLTNRGIAEAVVQAADVGSGDIVLEIGPGGGMLTAELLKVGAKVTAVEKDTAMGTLLKARFSTEIKNKQLILIEGDAREYTPDKVFPKKSYKVAANIPYYITGELIRNCLTAKNQPTSLAFLIQKEVAERIVRSKKESILSLSVKVYGTPVYVKTVKKGSFNPPPSVNSAIFAVKNISRKNFSKISEDHFFKIVKTGFAQKRKTLIGNLKRIFAADTVESAYNELNLNKKIRAEDVPLETWLLLAHTLTSN